MNSNLETCLIHQVVNTIVSFESHLLLSPLRGLVLLPVLLDHPRGTIITSVFMLTGLIFLFGWWVFCHDRRSNKGVGVIV